SLVSSEANEGKKIMMNLLDADIETMLNRLRGIPGLSFVILNAAEKIYRLYKLNKLDNDLEKLRETTAKTLQELERLAVRVENGEVRLAELEALVKRHEQTIADLTERLTAEL
ncbi:MAG: hypothetical protein P8Y36_01710, partial [Alphaproteobacteria bacterium]